MHNPSFAPDLLEVFFKGMGEVLPSEQWKFLIRSEARSEKSSISIKNLLSEAENQFGLVSASGLLFRCGGAAFKHVVRQLGKRVEIDSLEFRLQPQQKRLVDGTQKLVVLLESWQAAKFSIQQSDDLMELTASVSGVFFTDSGGRIWLHFIAGLFQEYIYWAGSGKQYPFQIISSDQPGKEIVIQFRIVPVD